MTFNSLVKINIGSTGFSLWTVLVNINNNKCLYLLAQNRNRLKVFIDVNINNNDYTIVSSNV